MKLKDKLETIKTQYDIIKEKANDKNLNTLKEKIETSHSRHYSSFYDSDINNFDIQSRIYQLPTINASLQSDGQYSGMKNVDGFIYVKNKYGEICNVDGNYLNVQIYKNNIYKLYRGKREIDRLQPLLAWNDIFDYPDGAKIRNEPWTHIFSPCADIPNSYRIKKVRLLFNVEPIFDRNEEKEYRMGK